MIITGQGKGLSPDNYLGNNLIRGYPDPALADGTQPIWWNITNDETLTEEDATGESISGLNERVLKLVISPDGGGADYAYQDFNAADEPTLYDNVTIVSAGVWVYQRSTDTAGTITLELYDVDGAASLGTATATAQDAWTFLKIENVTYQDSMRWRVGHSANNAIVYIANPSLNIGPTVRPWKSRNVSIGFKPSVRILQVNPADTNWHDLDLSSYITPNTVYVELHVYSYSSSAGNGVSFRPKGSTSTDEGLFVLLTSGTSSTYREGSTPSVMLGPNGVIQYKASSANVANITCTIRYIWEWK